MYPVGFTADLDGDLAAFGDEAVVDGGLLEHGGRFPFSWRLAGRSQHTACVFMTAHGRWQPFAQAALGERVRHPVDDPGMVLFLQGAEQLALPDREVGEVRQGARQRLGEQFVERGQRLPGRW